MSPAAFSESSCAAVSSATARVMFDAYSSHVPLDAGPCDEKKKKRRIFLLNCKKQSSAWEETHCALQHEKEFNLDSYHDTQRGKTNVTKAAYIETMKKEFGRKTLQSSLNLQTTVSIKASMAFDYPNLPREHPHRQLGNLDRRANPLAKGSMVWH